MNENIKAVAVATACFVIICFGLLLVVYVAMQVFS